MKTSAKIRRSRPNDAAVLVPAGAAAAGLGVVSAEAPMVGVGLVGFGLLMMLPWGALWVLFLFSSTLNKLNYTVAGATVRPSQVLLIPLALRVFTLTRQSLRPRWRLPEWTIVAFIAVQFATSYLNAQNRKASIFSAGLLALGALAYLTTFTSLVNRKRLVFAARVVLIMSVFSAGVALLSLFAHSIFGTTFGVSRNAVHNAAGGAGAVGLSQEHDILGSFSGAAAITFYLLRREINPVLSRRWATAGFLVCFLAMITSLTRAAWVGFAVAFAAALIFHRGRLRAGDRTMESAMTMLAVAVIGLGCFWLFRDITNPSASQTGLVASVQARGAKLLNVTSGTGANRLTVAEIALKDWKREPVLGLGTNSYGQRHTILIGKAGSPGYIANLYVRTLYDSGIIGLGLLVLFYGSVLWPRKFLKVSPGDLAPVARAFLFGMLVMVIGFAATDASFQVWPWVMLGMVRGAVRLAEVQYRELAGVRGRPARRRLPGPPARPPRMAEAR